MDTARFRDDLIEIPASLRELADAFEAGIDGLGRARALAAAPGTRVLVLGMGSSAYAAAVVARTARARGCSVVVELASTAALPPAAADLVVIAVSATGRSAEVLAAVEPYRGLGRLVAVTNDTASPLALASDVVVPLLAGVEVSGVSCRTFRHTFLVLEAILGGEEAGLPELVRASATASSALLEQAPRWLEQATGLLLGPQGTWLLAPVERLSSAQQSALMMREVPRRPAYASETGDWSHVDVYLSKTLDYRALLFAGSAWDEPAAEWLRGRSATLVTVGPTPLATEAALAIRYPGDERPEVAVLVETLVGELLAAEWFAADPGFGWSADLS
ncbi:SIS domain-containing protein [Herbiconiux sp. YIM B11900]|uniref:SIS domain-containing protein n=1 Tax=Herbiconiux sp. YIM B11900 TaxID=3404131 RepID=UPI003F865FE2